MPGAAPPRCTILVPSYNRLPCVVELLLRLQRQDYPSFEILIIEQSTDEDALALARIRALMAEDPRIRMEKHPKLSIGGARNAGFRCARGEIVLIIDDDDLPLGDDWVSRHLANFDDPHCIAVHGGEDREPGGAGGIERRFPKLAARWAMSYSPWGTPLAFPRIQQRKQNSQYVRGANSALRRDWAIRAGGWVDECPNGQEEHDFSFRLRGLMGCDDYIAFDPSARILRRLDIDGGMERRTATLEREIEGNVRFYFGVIARHMPWRVAILLPSYVWVVYFRALAWITDDRSYEPAAVRARALADLTLRYPGLFARSVGKAVRERVWRPPTPRVPISPAAPSTALSSEP